MEEIAKMGYDKREIEILTRAWDTTSEKPMKCPKCGKHMIIIQVEPVYDSENAYVPYDTIIECTSCSSKIRAESFTLLGGVKNFDLNHVEIGSWSPSGSRVLSNYEHILDYDLLKELKESRKLVEFLVVNEHIVEVME